MVMRTAGTRPTRSAIHPKANAPTAWPKLAMLRSAPTFSGAMLQSRMTTGST
jgi:hypothetical protein